MKEMSWEVGKKTPKNEMDNPSFLWRHKTDFWDTLSNYPIGEATNIIVMS